MFIFERLISLGFFFLAILIACYLMSRIKGKQYRVILALYLLVLTGFAWCYEPYITADLYRLRQYVEVWINLSFEGAFDYACHTTTPSWILFSYWEFAGSLVCCLFKGFGTATAISQLPLGDWLVWGIIIILLLFIVSGAIAYKKYMDRGVNNDKGSSFLTDQEIKKRGDDLIGMSWKAENFAKQIYNQDVRDSLIYGVEAPWGTGKSSFVNLCKANFISYEMLLFHFSALSSGPKAPISQVFMHDLIAFMK